MSNFVALVVEDDPLQREVMADLLKDEGLEVVECSTAEAAELVLVSTGTELKALVTDINLAGKMSGVELAAYAKRRFPHINVVMISGKGPPYVPDATSFLMKPFRPKELLRAVFT
jgi:CheY-like chemotaxis protein